MLFPQFSGIYNRSVSERAFLQRGFQLHAAVYTIRHKGFLVLSIIIVVRAVTFDLDMDSILHQFAEEVAFHIGFHDAACEIDR